MGLLVAGLVVGAVGCGGERSAATPAPVDDLGAVVLATRDAGTARVRIETRLEYAEGAIVTVIESISDLETGEGRGEITMQAEGPELVGGSGIRRQRFLAVGEYTYREVASDEWTRYPRDAGADPDGGAVEDADAYLDELAAAGDVEHLGRTELDGQPVDHYRADGPVPLEVWVTDDRRVRRVTSEDQVDEAGARIVTVFDYTDFGVALDLTPPPAEQVTDVDERRRQQLIEAAGIDPAPPGERPAGLPAWVPEDLPVPFGSTVVESETDVLRLSSPPAAGVEPREWFSRVQLLYDIELGNEVAEDAGPTSASDHGGPDGTVTKRTAERPFLLDGRAGTLSLEWIAGEPATRIEIRFLP